MFQDVEHKQLKRFISLFLAITFSCQSVGMADVFTGGLPQPGSLVALSPKIEPALLAGLQIDPQDPFKFNFLIRRAESPINEAAKPDEYRRLITYFLASLTLPNEDMWVNLSPVEHDRMIKDNFRHTAMGRDLLAQDYLLKQITASLIDPEGETGKAFWKKVYAKASEVYGTSDVPVDTFNKVWIIPDRAVVYEKNDTAVIVESHLKVMLETDYVLENQRLGLAGDTTSSQALEPTRELSKQVMRDVVIPVLEKEVNEGANFARLRQVASAMVMATWFKKSLRQSLLGRMYTDKSKVAGLDEGLDQGDPEKIYQLYLEAYRKGVFNFIKEEQDPVSGEDIPRKYFSGGIQAPAPDSAEIIHEVSEMSPRQKANFEAVIKSDVVKTRLFDSLKGAVGKAGLWAKALFSGKKAPLVLPELPTEKDIRLSKQSFEIDIPGQGKFVDLDHFVDAQKKVPAGQSYEDLIGRDGYTKAKVDGIIGYDPQTGVSTYEDPRLGVTLFDQSGTPRLRGITEAISNGIDALYRGINVDFMRGQFSKGVKQIVTWLEANGQDRVEVYTRQANGKAYKLTIIQAPQGTYFVQIIESSVEEFQARAGDVLGKTIEHGTVLRVLPTKEIPRTDAELKGEALYSLEGLARGIQGVSGFVRHFKVFLRIEDEAPVKVNGFHTIVEPEVDSVGSSEVDEGVVQVRLRKNEIAVADEGIGMDARPVSRMMAPGLGDKDPRILSPKEEDEELKSLIVGFKEIKGNNTVSFVRRGETVRTVNIPEDVHPEALVPDQGGLMIDLGLLLPVQESRGQFNLTTGFEKGILHAVRKVLELEGKTAQDKLRIINAMAFGLEGLEPGNNYNKNLVTHTLSEIQKMIAPLIDELKQRGEYALLPHQESFGRIKLPEGKKPLFVHSRLFSWRPGDLDAVGAKVLPGLKAGGANHLPILLMPFTDEALKGVSRMSLAWHAWKKGDRVPVIKTDRYVVVPAQIFERLRGLADKKNREELSAVERMEYFVWVQLLKIKTDDEGVTQYEDAAPKQSLVVEEKKTFEGPKTKRDENLAKLLEVPPGLEGLPTALPGQPPAGSSMKLALIEKTNELVEIGTGRQVMQNNGDGIKAAEPLTNGYYLVTFKNGDQQAIQLLSDPSKPALHELYSSMRAEVTLRGRLVVSPDKNFVYHLGVDQNVDTVLDMREGKRKVISKIIGRPLENALDEQRVHVSRDGTHLFVDRRDGRQGGERKGYLIDTKTWQVGPSVPSHGTMEVELDPGDAFVMNPLADAFIIRREKTGKLWLFDFKKGYAGAPGFDHIRTSSNGEYSVLKLSISGFAIYDHINGTLNMLPPDIKDVVILSFPQGRVQILVNNEKGKTFKFLPLSNPATEYDYLREMKDGDVVALHHQAILTEYINETDVLLSTGQPGSANFIKDNFQDGVLEPSVYKHPDLDVLIDRRDPQHPALIGLSAGDRIPFVGEVLGADKDWVGGRLPTGQYYNSSSARGIELVNVPVQVVEGGKEFFLMHLDPAAPGAQYLLVNRHEQKRIVLPDIDAVKYSRVIFDGKFYLFTDPLTGDAVYLDPSLPEAPLVVPVKASSDGLFRDLAKDVPRIEASAATWDLDPAWVRKAPSDDGHVYEVVMKPGWVRSKDVKTLQEMDGFVVDSKGDTKIIEESSSGRIRKAIIDLSGDKINTGRLDVGEDVWLSSSGNYALFKNEAGKYSVISDIKKNMTTHAVTFSVEIVGHRILPQRDMVIFKLKDGTYSLHDLKSPRAPLIEGVSHLEVTSGGDMAVFKRNGKLYFLDLAGPESEQRYIKVDEGKSLRIGRTKDGGTVVIETPDLVGPDSSLQIYWRDGGGRLLPRGAGITLREVELAQEKGEFPELWEYYDLGSKAITVGHVRPPGLEPALYSGEPPTIGSRQELIVMGSCYWDRNRATLTSEASGFSVQMPTINILEGDVVALEGNNVFYRSSLRGHLSRGMTVVIPRNSGYVSFKVDVGFVSTDKRFLVFKDLETGELVVVNEQGEVRKLAIPSGFSLVGTYDEQFVFGNEATGEVKWLDLKAVFAEAKPAMSAQDNEKSASIRQVWESKVLSLLDNWLGQEKAVHAGFFEGATAELSFLATPLMEKLERQQDKEVRERFQAFLDKGNPQDGLDLSGLPLDRFAARMALLAPLLGPYVKALIDRTVQDPVEVQRSSMSDLVRKLFALLSDDKRAGEAIDDDLLETLSLGWDVSSSRELATRLKAALVKADPTITFGRQRKIMSFLGKFVARAPLENAKIVEQQLEEILTKVSANGTPYVKLMIDAFDHKDATVENLSGFLTDPLRGGLKIGEARPFAVFLTNKNAKQVREAEERVPSGTDLFKKSVRITQTQMLRFWQRMMKSSDDKRPVMTPEELADAVNEGLLPEMTEADRKAELKIINDMQNQAEPGAHTREGAANARDSILKSGLHGFFSLWCYLTGKSAQPEFVEEYRDTGVGAPFPMTMAMPISSKAEGGQVETTGFFGAGNQTFFRDTDKVVRITSNKDGAYMFTFERDLENDTKQFFLTGLRKINDSELETLFGAAKTGVIVRRKKVLANSIPEIDRMLAERALKTFAGLAQHDGFTMTVENEKGEPEPLEVEASIIGETDLTVGEGAGKKLKIWQTKDMPSQIVDSSGYRVSDIPEEYLTYIPIELRPHIEELGIIIQVPMPLTRSRNEFEDYETHKKEIWKSVAVAFYRALAYKTMTQSSPQFNFEGYSMDTEKSDDRSYWDSVLKDKVAFKLAGLINGESSSEISEQDLALLARQPDGISKVRRFVNLILLLKVAIDQNKPDVKQSIMDRRARVQAAVDPEGAARHKSLFADRGYSFQSDAVVPEFEAKVSTGRTMVTGHEQMKDPGKFVLDRALTPAEQELAHLAGVMAAAAGVEQVLLIEGTAFAGAFKLYKGKRTMFLTRTLADKVPDPEAKNGIIEDRVDTVIHELAHLLEGFIAAGDADTVWNVGFLAPEDHETETRTHQAKGLFTDAMQYLAGVAAFHLAGMDDWLTADPVIVTPLVEQAAEADPFGGIDLNEKHLDLQIQREGDGISLDVSNQPEELMNIQGLSPEILEIAPLDPATMMIFNH
ncbi:MAG: hypothetical protein WCO69_03705 [Candidatus Omnitrophota bacterium]